MKLTHPESGQTITVAADTAPMYASQGWVEDAPADEKPKGE